MEEKRKAADARIAREKQEKAKERSELALEKARYINIVKNAMQSCNYRLKSLFQLSEIVRKEFRP